MSATNTKCKYCQARLKFVRNSMTSKWLPIDAEPIRHDGSPSLVVIVDGNYVICTRQAVAGEVVYRPHWLNPRCPKNHTTEKTDPAASSKAKLHLAECFDLFDDGVYPRRNNG
jgi:hypothetical protein